MTLTFDRISKSYGKIKALQNFSATLSPGVYALLGPNGSGKSTLMNIITDNIKADSGEITYCSNDGKCQNVFEMGSEFREKIGYMPQYPGLYPDFSVMDFLWYIASLKNMGIGRKKKDRKEYIDEQISMILKTVELDDISHLKIKALSGGMKQRLALAQAVLGDPDILILDEPTAGLDPKQRISIRNFISQIALNKIVLIATHVVSDIEYIARNIILLKKGVIVGNAPPEELISQIDEMVWEVPCHENDISSFQQKYRVTNIMKTNYSPSSVTLRILSSSRPTISSTTVSPLLEDYYLYVFGNQ